MTTAADFLYKGAELLEKINQEPSRSVPVERLALTDVSCSFEVLPEESHALLRELHKLDLIPDDPYTDVKFFMQEDRLRAVFGYNGTRKSVRDVAKFAARIEQGVRAVLVEARRVEAMQVAMQRALAAQSRRPA